MKSYLFKIHLHIISVLGLLPICLTSHAASFDCAKAASNVEKSICNSKTLSSMDVKLSKLYKASLRRWYNKNILIRSERYWINLRNNCRTNGCLIKFYEERIQYLKKLSKFTPASANIGYLCLALWGKIIGNRRHQLIDIPISKKRSQYLLRQYCTNYGFQYPRDADAVRHNNARESELRVLLVGDGFSDLSAEDVSNMIEFSKNDTAYQQNTSERNIWSDIPGYDGPIILLKDSENTHSKLCARAYNLLISDPACRPFNNDNGLQVCGNDREYTVNLNGHRVNVYKEIATIEYGYNQIKQSNQIKKNEYSIIYLDHFNGDPHPRTIETWQVPTVQLDKVLRIPPGPVTYKERFGYTCMVEPCDNTKYKKYPISTNSKEFDDMLRSGMKLSNEWSPAIDIGGNPYLLVRKCKGQWVFGGYYECDKVKSITVLKLNKNKTPDTICEFTANQNK